jgi:hypothetical protein
MCIDVSLAETPQLPSSPRIFWTRITRTLLVSQDRRHFFVTPCSKINIVIYKFIAMTGTVKLLPCK